MSVFTHIPRGEEEEEGEEVGNELSDVAACPSRGRTVGEDVVGGGIGGEDEMSDVAACPGRGRVVGQVEFKGEGRGETTSHPTSLPARAEGELSDEMSGLECV